MYRDADEVFDGDAASGDRRWSDSRNLVSTLCRPAGQVTDYTSMGQQVFLLCRSRVAPSLWPIRIR